MILSGPASPISPGSMGFLTPLWPRGPSPLSARRPISPATSAFASRATSVLSLRATAMGGGVHYHGRCFMALSDLPNLGEDRLFISLWALSARAQFT